MGVTNYHTHLMIKMNYVKFLNLHILFSKIDKIKIYNFWTTHGFYLPNKFF